VKICSLYGAGFYYIPGTDTCLKVGGWVRFETSYGYNGSMTTEWFNVNTNNRSTNENTWRVKGTVTFDAREQTAYGTLRSYAALGVSNNNNGDNAGAANYANRWFIQWAGFTIGHATSFFDFYSIGGNQYGFATASSDTGDGGWDVFGYTAQFGNGMSASLAAEVARRTKLINASAAGLPAIQAAAAVGAVPAHFNTGYGGHDMPDLVANLRVDQAWGSAQIMGALHYVNGTYYGGNETFGGPDGKLGFAVGAGLKLNAPMIGAGDYFQMEVDYTKGASRYSNSTATTWDYAKYDGGSFGWGYEADGVYGGALGATASNIELISTWAVNAAYTHFWTPALKSTLWGSYRESNFNGAANAMVCSAAGFGNGVLGAGATAAPGCDMDWSVWGIGLRTEWAATKNLSFGLEVLYSELNSASTPTGLVTTGSGTKPVQAYTVADQDQVAVRFRVNRNFYP
jgi:hypothetical protein